MNSREMVGVGELARAGARGKRGGRGVEVNAHQ